MFSTSRVASRLQRPILLSKPILSHYKVRQHSQSQLPAPEHREKIPTRSTSSPNHPKNEVHEHSEVINVPFNLPGGGGGSGPGGSGGSFKFTGSPLADAALTTIVGLGMSKFFCLTLNACI